MSPTTQRQVSLYCFENHQWFVSEQRHVVYLVKRWKDVVCKLDFGYGCGPSNRRTNAKSHNPLLTKGSVEDSVLTWKQKQKKRIG